MKTQLNLIMLLLALSISPAMAQKVTQPRGGPAGSWRVIGTVQADHAADHDVLVVSGPHDDFRSIKFKVTNASLNMHRMVVTYENGQPDQIEVRQEIPQGGESRVIDLAGAGKRRIRKIEFWYDTKGLFNGKAEMTVFGKK